PFLLGAVAVLAAAGCGVAVSLILNPRPAQRTGSNLLTTQQAKALEHQAFALAEVRPGLSRPVSTLIKVLPGDTLQSAVQRSGIGADEARTVVQ
ncbi:hypothetical protein ABTC24_19230, partial [Acinetobacter baumannii]